MYLAMFRLPSSYSTCERARVATLEERCARPDRKGHAWVVGEEATLDKWGSQTEGVASSGSGTAREGATRMVGEEGLARFTRSR